MPDDHSTRMSATRRTSAQNDLGVVSLQRSLHNESNGLDARALRSLTDATLSDDRYKIKTAVKAARDLGISDEALADDYIPNIARQIGEEWCTDETNFALVTIATSRLQAMLREIGRDWNSNDSAAANAPSVLLIVPDNCHHTLGPIAFAGQLRRRGLSVRLLLDADVSDVKACLTNLLFSAVMISVAQRELSHKVRKIITSVRGFSPDGLPIVVGGPMLWQNDAPSACKLGADFATNDPDEAIALCDLYETTRIPCLLNPDR